MTYQYCRKCDNEVSEPTIEEDLNDEWNCPQCGANQGQAHSIEEYVLELHERITKLENK